MSQYVEAVNFVKNSKYMLAKHKILSFLTCEIGFNSIEDFLHNQWCFVEYTEVTVKNISAGSLDCDVCQHFLRAKQNFVVKWHHNSDIVSGFELCQMIAFIPKFYEFCLHLTELSSSPFSTALNVEEQHFSQLSYSWRTLTELSLCFSYRNKIGTNKSA